MSRSILGLFISVIVFIAFAGFTKNNCEKLTNGIYKMVTTYPLLQKESFKIKITDRYFTSYWNNKDCCNGIIEWPNQCYFNLIYAACGTITPINKRTELLKESFGKPLYELKHKNGDTIFFRSTYSGNIHITSGEGYFLKIE